METWTALLTIVSLGVSSVTHLDVMSREVVEPAGRCGSDRGVDPVMIVEVHPPRQRGPAFGL